MKQHHHVISALGLALLASAGGAQAQEQIVTIGQTGPLSGSNAFAGKDNENGAVDAVGVDWSAHQSVLLSCVESTAKLGFFRVTPWFPERSSLRDALLAQFPNCQADGFDVFGYFEPTSRNLELLFGLWQERGAWASGEWQIGGCLGKFQESAFKTSYGGLEYFLRQIHNVGCVLSLEEMQQSTLLTSPFAGLTASLKALEAGENSANKN